MCWLQYQSTGAAQNETAGEQGRQYQASRNDVTPHMSSSSMVLLVPVNGELILQSLLNGRGPLQGMRRSKHRIIQSGSSQSHKVAEQNKRGF